jgi:hypothetical protein
MGARAQRGRWVQNAGPPHWAAWRAAARAWTDGRRADECAARRWPRHSPPPTPHLIHGQHRHAPGIRPRLLPRAVERQPHRACVPGADDARPHAGACTVQELEEVRLGGVGEGERGHRGEATGEKVSIGVRKGGGMGEGGVVHGPLVRPRGAPAADRRASIAVPRQGGGQRLRCDMLGPVARRGRLHAPRAALFLRPLPVPTSWPSFAACLCCRSTSAITAVSGSPSTAPLSAPALLPPLPPAGRERSGRSGRRGRGRGQGRGAAAAAAAACAAARAVGARPACCLNNACRAVWCLLRVSMPFETHCREQSLEWGALAVGDVVACDWGLNEQ